jgi:hypothetical protein
MDRLIKIKQEEIGMKDDLLIRYLHQKLEFLTEEYNMLINMKNTNVNPNDLGDYVILVRKTLIETTYLLNRVK